MNAPLQAAGTPSIHPQALPQPSCVTLDGPQHPRPWLPHPLHKGSGQAVPRAPSIIHLGSLGSQCQKGALTKDWVGFSLTTVFHSTKKAAHCPLSRDVWWTLLQTLSDSPAHSDWTIGFLWKSPKYRHILWVSRGFPEGFSGATDLNNRWVFGLYLYIWVWVSVCVWVYIKTIWRLCWVFSLRTLRHQESLVRLSQPIFLSLRLLSSNLSLLLNEPLFSSGSSCSTSKAGLRLLQLGGPTHLPMSPLSPAPNIKPNSISLSNVPGPLFHSHGHHCRIYTFLSLLELHLWSGLFFSINRPASPQQDWLLPLPGFSEPIKHKNITTVVYQASASCQSWHWRFHSPTLQSLQYEWIYIFGPGSWGSVTTPVFLYSNLVELWLYWTNDWGAGVESASQSLPRGPSTCPSSTGLPRWLRQ